MESQFTTVWYLDVLSRTGKITDLTNLRKQILKNHASWSYALAWFNKNNRYASHDLKSIQAQIQKNTLLDKNKINSQIDAELKRSQYWWAGYTTSDEINELDQKVKK